MGLATDTTVYLSRRGGALKVKKMTFTIRASNSSWHPGLPGRPLFPKISSGYRFDLIFLFPLSRTADFERIYRESRTGVPRS